MMKWRWFLACARLAKFASVYAVMRIAANYVDNDPGVDVTLDRFVSFVGFYFLTSETWRFFDYLELTGGIKRAFQLGFPESGIVMAAVYTARKNKDQE